MLKEPHGSTSFIQVLVDGDVLPLSTKPQSVETAPVTGTVEPVDPTATLRAKAPGLGALLLLAAELCTCINRGHTFLNGPVKLVPFVDWTAVV